MLTAPALNPGILDRRVTLRYPTVTRSASGAAIEAWVSSATVWARWLPQNSREFVAAQARHSETSGVLRIRYRSGLAATWRIHLGGVLYKLAGDPLEVGRREYLDLPVQALNAEAAPSEGVETFGGAALETFGGEAINTLT